MSAILSISADGSTYTDLPDPAELTISLQDIDAATTTRSADGTILRDRVCGAGTAKRKFQIKWNYIGSTVATQILSSAMAQVFFYVKYFDPYTGATRVAEMYAGDRSLPMYNYNLRNGGILWESLSVDWIEK